MGRPEGMDGMCRVGSLALLLHLCGAVPHAIAEPVKVYILSGQSNMVGIGQVNGGGSRWGEEFVDPVLSVYEGSYDPAVDYAAQTAKRTMPLEAFGGVRPTPYPGGGVQIVRGTLSVKTSGLYELRPGYGDSTYNVMTVGGVEVYRKEPGQEEASHEDLRLEGGKRYPFKTTFFTRAANSLFWVGRTDVPGTLDTVVKQQGRFPWMLGDDGKWKLRPIEPGIVFSVDPQLWIPEEQIYIRVEDTVAVTEDGIENLTAAAPLELDDVEAAMKETSLLEKHPPESWAT